MSIPNIGPERHDTGDLDGPEPPRRGNPPLVYRDEPLTDEVTAATARASAVTHRFGGIRYALTRPDTQAANRERPTEEGDSDARE
jgi:hypothetical protein